MGKTCKNCGWENAAEAVVCEKCHIPFDGEGAKVIDTPNEYSAPDNADKNTPFMWKIRKGIYIYALISMTGVVMSTIMLYSFYGPLTPHGNRYYHSFDITSVPFWVVILSIIAMSALLYPIYRYYHSKNPDYYWYGVFPSKSRFAKIASVFLTILNLLTGFVFTISYIFTTLIYIVSYDRVMADDLETLMLGLALWGCTIFWASIDLIYTIIYRKGR